MSREQSRTPNLGAPFLQARRANDASSPDTMTASPAPSSRLGRDRSDLQSGLESASKQSESLMRVATQSHRAYWEKQPGSTADGFWRYDLGWKCGWTDGISFLSARIKGELGGHGGDKIGLLGSWVQKRVRDCSQSGEQLWQL